MIARCKLMVFAALFCAVSVLSGLADVAGPISAAEKLSDQGDFKGAALVLRNALTNGTLPSVDRKNLEWQLDSLERVRKDYSDSKETLFADLSGSLRDFSREEFEKWIAEGRFDSRTI